jgi:UDP-3-O-acyl-N-acetylglucosamine deacetylase
MIIKNKLKKRVTNIIKTIMLKLNMKITKTFHSPNKINFNSTILFPRLTDRKKIKILTLNLQKRSSKHNFMENLLNSRPFILIRKINIKKS